MLPSPLVPSSSCPELPPPCHLQGAVLNPCALASKVGFVEGWSWVPLGCWGPDPRWHCSISGFYASEAERVPFLLSHGGPTLPQIWLNVSHKDKGLTESHWTLKDSKGIKKGKPHIDHHETSAFTYLPILFIVHVCAHATTLCRGRRATDGRVSFLLLPRGSWERNSASVALARWPLFGILVRHDC